MVKNSASSRLSKSERRQQLLDTARTLVREEGADRLTLGRLAARAGVSKPIAYEHFGTRAGLLIELYKAIDAGQAEALRERLLATPRGLEEIASELAAAYMHCYSDTSGEWHQVGAALSGSEAMDAVHQELLDSYVALFADALRPHSDLPAGQLQLRCIGLIGAGEALSAAMVRGEATEGDAAEALAALMRASVSAIAAATAPCR